MSLAKKMFEVRAIRKEIENELEKLANLCGTPEARDALITDWRNMEALRKLVPTLDWAVSRLRDREREALEMQREEEQMKSVFDDGRLCP